LDVAQETKDLIFLDQLILSSECPITILIFWGYLVGNSKLSGQLGKNSLLADFITFNKSAALMIKILFSEIS
jgi:hypothetical protein